MNTYTKLRNGSWGVRVEGYCRTGLVVTVTTKGGKKKHETIDKIFWSGNGLSICSIVKKEQPAPVQQERETVREVKPDVKKPSWVYMPIQMESEPEMSTPTVPVGFHVRGEEDFGF